MDCTQDSNGCKTYYNAGCTCGNTNKYRNSTHLEYTPTMMKRNQHQAGYPTRQASFSYKSQDNTAQSLTSQPFVPKQVMDIARPLPMNTGSTKRENSMSMAKVQQSHDASNMVPCRCGIMCGDQAMRETTNIYNHGGTVERSRSVDPNRISQIVEPTCVSFPMENCQSAIPMAEHVEFTRVSDGNIPPFEVESPRAQRSRGVWRSNTKSRDAEEHEMINAVPNSHQLAQHQVYQMSSRPGHCHCMNPRCPVHAATGSSGTAVVAGGSHTEDSMHGFMRAPQRSRSYEVLDTIPSVNSNGLINTAQGYSILRQGPSQIKASLPPASHHSPEQRTSYRL